MEQIDTRNSLKELNISFSVDITEDHSLARFYISAFPSHLPTTYKGKRLLENINLVASPYNISTPLLSITIH